MSCGVGQRCGLELELLWLWRRPAATAPIRPLAWEPPYAAGVTLKRQKRQGKKKKDPSGGHLFKKVYMSQVFFHLQVNPL